LGAPDGLKSLVKAIEDRLKQQDSLLSDYSKSALMDPKLVSQALALFGRVEELKYWQQLLFDLRRRTNAPSTMGETSDSGTGANGSADDPAAATDSTASSKLSSWY
jgi:hypothetical protein